MATSSETIRKYEGPAFFQRGYRPFFFSAALYAAVVIPLWIGVQAMGWNTSGYLPAREWHVHELVFGYVPAVMSGFLLTAIPNWTGRLPVAGARLAILWGIWVLGRFVMNVELFSAPVAASIECAFLVALAALAWREVMAGKNIKNAPVCIIITVLALANIGFHLSVFNDWDTTIAERAGLALIALLINLIGGRVVPSFTRNWLAKRKSDQMPAKFGKTDIAATVVMVVALVSWVTMPEATITAGLALCAAIMLTVRLVSWKGWLTGDEFLLLILHIGYAWLPFWFALMAMQILGSDLVDQSSALHALTAGAIGTMTLAVMSRATLGHSGRALTADTLTKFVFLLVLAGALVRVFAGVFENDMILALSISGMLWSAGFALFVIGYAPIFFKRA